MKSLLLQYNLCHLVCSWKAPIHNVTELSSGEWFLASWCAAKLLVEAVQLLLREFEELLQQLQLLVGQLARVPAAQRAKWWIILNLYLSLEIAAKLFPILALRTYKLSSNKCFYFQLPQPFRYYLVLLSKSSEVNSSFNKSKLVSFDIGDYVMNKRHELSENHWSNCVWTGPLMSAPLLPPQPPGHNCSRLTLHETTRSHCKGWR